jgi:hypothetical protein
MEVVKAFLFWVKYTHYPMHCMQQASTAVHACCRSARRNEVAYMPKTVVVFTAAYLYRTIRLSLQSYMHYDAHVTMSERGRCPDDCESCNFDDLTRSCFFALAPGLTSECFVDFCWDFMCTVVGRLCRISVLYCTSPKVCLIRTNLGSRFIVCGFSSDPSWIGHASWKSPTANPNENWRHNN